MSELDPVKVNYVREFTRLSLWYACKQIRDGEDDFEDAVNVRVNIYRNTSLYDGRRHPSGQEVGPEWAEILERLRAVFDRHRDDASTGPLEDEELELLWPYMEARLRRGGDRMPPLEDRPYECWRFDTRNDRVNIHILNLYQPRSPLSDMRIPFAASLLRLLRDARAEWPEVETVRCGSWLNSVPPFQALFPERWKGSAVYRQEIRYTMGHWGQFTDRRGDFHTRNGARFRETGRLPFPSSSCECPIEDAIVHLETRFPEAVAYNTNRSQALP